MEAIRFLIYRAIEQRQSSCHPSFTNHNTHRQLCPLKSRCPHPKSRHPVVRRRLLHVRRCSCWPIAPLPSSFGCVTPPGLGLRRSPKMLPPPAASKDELRYRAYISYRSWYTPSILEKNVVLDSDTVFKT